MGNGKIIGKLLAIVTAVLQFTVWASAQTSAAGAAEQKVTINSIRRDGTDLVVEVQLTVPAKRVFLESRSRVERGAWKPVAVQYATDPEAGTKAVTFRVPMGATMELLRARADTSTALPDSFYKGTNSFETAGGPNSGGPMAFRGGLENLDVATGAPAADNREVVESDIWNLKGDTLYFFNQNRGLQIIDIANPDAPVIRGTYALPSSGEQMYVLGSTHVVLLAQSYCYYSTGNQSQVVVLDVTGGNPQLVAELPVPGNIVESRLVGRALYVVSGTYRVIEVEPVGGGAVSQTWEWGNQVVSFDLSDPAHPQAKSSAWVAGYGAAVYATDRFLFVAGPAPTVVNGGEQSWDWNSVAVRIFDISAPDGTMSEVATIRAAGQVQDKFKMQLNGDVFTFVTMNWQNDLESRVHTFSLADPRAPQKLGSLVIKTGEQLFATRFAGNLLYAVTFQRIDPLWIIDLSDPANPRKVSELELPGWSTYIHPLGDQLLTIGIDRDGTWRTSIQLFDVKDPAKPALLSRELLGEKWSSSEANYNEKALTVLPEQKLILLPLSQYVNDQHQQGVQIVDLEPDKVRPRGFIANASWTRRATFHRERIVSISAEELVTVDATDRDNPKIVAHTELSWPVDQVILAGDHLIELSPGWSQDTTLHVVRADETGTILNRVALKGPSLLAAAAHEQKLYVLQGTPEQLVWPTVWDPTKPEPIDTIVGTLVLTIFDLSKLPELPMLGSAKTETHERWFGQFQALWPKPGVLVWGPGGQENYYWDWRWMAVGGGVRGGAMLDVAGPFWGGWWSGGGNGHFVACQVANPAEPKFVSDLDLRPDPDGWWSFSEPILSGTLVYTSHQSSEWDPDFQPPTQINKWFDGTKWITETVVPPKGLWVQRYYLDVIDYADEQEPAVRKSVSIPGSLIGLAGDGALLFTRGYAHNEANWWDYRETIYATSYDGVEARLVTQMELPTQWPHPSISFDGHVLLGQPGSAKTDTAPEVKPSLELWALSVEGKFARQAALQLDTAADSFELLNDILAVRSSQQHEFYDATNPLAFRSVGGDTTCSWWYSLAKADGSVERGIWLPLGASGVRKIDFAKPQ